MLAITLTLAYTQLSAGSALAATQSPTSPGSTHGAAAQRATRAADPTEVGPGIQPVYDQTVVGGFVQAGNTFLDCATTPNPNPPPDNLVVLSPTGAPLNPDPAIPCGRDIQAAVDGTYAANRTPHYNDQVLQAFMDRDNNDSTGHSSSVTVTIPQGAVVAYAELEWSGWAYAAGQNNPVPNPDIWSEPMKVSIGNDQDYQSITPDAGTQATPGTPADNTSAYAYSSWANITSLMAGRGSDTQSTEITVWGADAPFYQDAGGGFALNRSALGWHLAVVYDYPGGVDLSATPQHVAKAVRLQAGLVLQIPNAGPTDTTVNVPEITNPDNVQVGLTAIEGDAGIHGDTFAIDNTPITQPFTSQDDDFFQSFTQVAEQPDPNGATNPDWTSNFSVDDLSWTLGQNGTQNPVTPGQTTMLLTTDSVTFAGQADTYGLTALNTAVPTAAVCLSKSVTPNPYTTVGETLNYTLTVTNCSGADIDRITVTDNTLGTLPADCDHPLTLGAGDSYECHPTHLVDQGDIAAGSVNNTATADAFVAGTDTPVAPATASATTSTSTTLQILKTGAPKPVAPGGTFEYTITVTNTGGADAANVSVSDPLPAALTSWTATASSPAVTVSPDTGGPGGTITATAPLLPHAAGSNSFTVTVSGTIASDFTGTTIRNTATVEADGNTNCPTGSTDPNCSSTDETPVLPPATITITKVTDPPNAAPKPGETFHYTVQVTNTSTTTTAHATLNDPIPSELTLVNWTCSATTDGTSACGTPSGTTSPVNSTLVLAPLGVATFRITVTVPAGFAGGTITNTATATPDKPGTVCETDPGAASCDASVPITVTPSPALITISKTHSPTTPGPGDAITYTVVVTNTSTTTTAHATLDDPVPSQIVADGTWTTATTGTGTSATPATDSGFPSGVTLVIAPGGTVTFTIPAHVSTTYDGSTVTNVATATPTPGMNTECANGQPTCSADTSFSNPARLEIAKTHSPMDPDPVPGQQVTYHVTITNPSSVVAHGTFSDPLPTQLDAATATWTCAATGTGTCPAGPVTGSPTNVAITVAPGGGTVTFTIVATINPSATAVTIHNIASVTPGANTECADGSTPTCDADDTFTATPEPAPLCITKTHSPTTPSPPGPGEAITYTVVVTNLSQFTTAHATFDDPPPPQINPDGNWTTTTTGTGTSVTPSSGSGFPTGETITMVIAPGGSITFTIHAHVRNPYDGSPIVNTATATPTPGGNTTCEDGNPTCQAQDSFTNPARLTITKTRVPPPPAPAPTPGEQVVYQVTITNPVSGATGVGTFSDPLPPQLDAATATWTCTASAGSSCPAGPVTGSPTNVPITVASNGGTVTFTITATILPNEGPVTVHNIGTVTPGADTECMNGDPTCSADDSFTFTPDPAPLEIAKTQSPATPEPGGAITYTVTVTNPSPSTIAHATFDDPPPAQINPDGNWTTTTTGAGTTVTPSSGSGFPTGQTITLTIAPGGSVTFTINAHVRNPYDGSPVVNTATATPGLNTTCADGRPTCQAQVSFTNPARLLITKTHSPTNPDPRPGDTVTYTVTISNPGSGADGQGTFSDPLPAQLDASTATWSCSGAATPAGSSCGPPTSGSGSPTDVPITVAPNGGTVTFTITATIKPSQVAVTIHNVGTVTPGTDTECMDGNPTCSADDTFTSTPPPATITIHKTHAPADPKQGQSVTYTVTVNNTSTTTQAVGTVNDPFDTPALTGITWTAAGTGGATVSPASGSGAISAVSVTLPVGGVVTFTVHATVRSDWPGGDVVNTSVVTPGENTDCDPPGGADPSCSAPDTFPTPSLISITKTHEPTNPLPQPGQNVTYRVTVTNLSDQQAAHATFDDPLPSQVNASRAVWATETTGTGTTVSPASGTGPPSGVNLTLGPSGTVTFIITAPINSDFQGGTITNTGSAHPGDNTACESGDPVCDASTSFEPDIPPAPLQIRKSVAPNTPPLRPGDHVTYTITVTNLSPNITGHATITDAVPAGMIAGSWTATASSGSTVTPTSGSGLITAQVTIPAGGHVTFTRQGQVDPSFTGDFDIVNVGTLAPGTNSLCDPNDPGAECNADAVVHVTTPTPPPPPKPTPSPSPAPPRPPKPPAKPGLPTTGWGGAQAA